MGGLFGFLGARSDPGLEGITNAARKAVDSAIEKRKPSLEAEKGILVMMRSGMVDSRAFWSPLDRLAGVYRDLKVFDKITPISVEIWMYIDSIEDKMKRFEAMRQYREFCSKYGLNTTS